MIIFRLFLLMSLIMLGTACSVEPSAEKDSSTKEVKLEENANIPEDEEYHSALEDTIPAESEVEPSIIEQKVIDQGLVNVRSLDASLELDIRYATENNFMGKVLYEGYDKCFLQEEVAHMLVNAHEILKQVHPDLRFLIFDGTRPRSIQEIMWEKVKGTPEQEYVASPKSGSMHNYGAAIDLSLTHIDTGELDMGTPYDFFGEEAQPRYEEKFLSLGKLSQAQVSNRRMLRRAMNQSGFTGILNEWWHFNAYPNKVTRKRFTIVE